MIEKQYWATSLTCSKLLAGNNCYVNSGRCIAINRYQLEFEFMYQTIRIQLLALIQIDHNPSVTKTIEKEGEKKRE